jgi:hypothetical protein
VETLVITGSGIAVLAVFLLTIVPWRRVDATARGFSWHRLIDINQQIWEQRKHSPVSPPSNARNVKRSQKLVRHSTSMASRANGFSSTSYRYETVYTYEIPRWQRARTVTAVGEGQADVHWPSCRLNGNERTEREAESYKAVFETASGKLYTARLHEAEWRSLEAGTTYPLRLNALGRVLKVRTPAGR